jgi:hypothetical protein
MKKILWILLFTTSSLAAQVDSSFISKTLSVDIVAIDFNGSKVKLNNFVKNNYIKVQVQDENQYSINLQATISEKQYEDLEKLLPELGFVSTKRLNTEDNYEKYRDAEFELRHLNKKRAAYADQLNKTNYNSENYIAVSREMKELDESIYYKERDIMIYKKHESGIKLSLNLAEENTTPDETKIAFVNMPGVEYSYLRIESPKGEISSNSYQGVFVKYLFTRGKSYATAGAYKSINGDTSKNATQFSELFLLGFGQDFYTRHLGRGKRKFFNLYSGYLVGDILATNATKKSNIIFLQPSVGVEIFKNKYMLFDVKANYFIPLSYNRNLRGVSFNTSFNFVF